MMVPQFHGVWNWLAWLLIVAALSPSIRHYVNEVRGKR